VRRGGFIGSLWYWNRHNTFVLDAFCKGVATGKTVGATHARRNSTAAETGRNPEKFIEVVFVDSVYALTNTREQQFALVIDLTCEPLFMSEPCRIWKIPPLGILNRIILRHSVQGDQYRDNQQSEYEYLHRLPLSGKEQVDLAENSERRKNKEGENISVANWFNSGEKLEG
jgi:hypothetical protein